jgi:RimJ/RimL family protein N-acetyltransferase
MEKFDYIVAFYLEQRRNPLYKDLPKTDRYFFIEKHLEFLSKHHKNIKNLNKVYLIGNVDKVEEFLPIYKDITKLIKDYQLDDVVDCDIKPNAGLSYGAWEHTLIKNLSNPKPKYAFLIEDDYVPTTPDFCDPFITKMKSKENVGYVASLYWSNVNHPHAAISNGLIDYDICVEIYKENNRVFNLTQTNTPGYADAGKNQVSFLDIITRKGYSVLDVADLCSIPFLDLGLRNNKPSIVNYGDKNKKSVIEPIIDVQGIKIFPMKESDLEFLCEVRNECAPEFLHTSETYTLEQTKEWYNKTSPLFFIIKRREEKIGYFRTSNYSKTNKNIYIGADIHKNFRGKGFGYTSYVMFIPYLFETLDLNKISLEVLSTNTNAIKLYEKLGFVQEGVKRQEVLKNGEWVDSIIMSILKNEWNE